MSRNRIILGLFVAILLAALLSTFVYKKFQEVASQTGPVSTRTIVVASQPLPLGTRLEPSMLRTIPWPGDEPMPGMFTRVEDCVNRALITQVAENEPILEGKLAPKDAGAGLPAVIPQGMRGISVAVNDVIGVAGFVTPGTMVDVLVTGAAPGTSAQMMETRTLLENVRVLAAGQKTEQDRDGKPQTVPVITLLVNPEDAAKLALASTEGKIQLALRNTVDTHDANPAPVYQSTIFGGAPPNPNPAPAPRKSAPVKMAAPPPPPPAPYTVEVITGSKRETKSFPNQPQQHQ
jgi:pilus assembly protein CpaB